MPGPSMVCQDLCVCVVVCVCARASMRASERASERARARACVRNRTRTRAPHLAAEEMQPARALEGPAPVLGLASSGGRPDPALGRRWRPLGRRGLRRLGAAAPRGRRGLALRAGEGGEDWSAAGRDQAGAASAVRGALEPVRAG